MDNLCSRRTNTPQVNPKAQLSDCRSLTQLQAASVGQTAVPRFFGQLQSYLFGLPCIFLLPGGSSPHPFFFQYFYVFSVDTFLSQRCLKRQFAGRQWPNVRLFQRWLQAGKRVFRTLSDEQVEMETHSSGVKLTLK